MHALPPLYSGGRQVVASCLKIMYWARMSSFPALISVACMALDTLDGSGFSKVGVELNFSL